MARLSKPVFVGVIIAINVLVFLGWELMNPEFMARNFLASWDGLVAGRFWILLGSAFSHNMFWHLFLNMYVLSSFGSIIEAILGHRRFIGFYLFAGILASLCHCLASNFIMERPNLPALGASGAVAGVVLVFSLMLPKQKIMILGIIPIKAIWGALLFVGLDLWGLMAQAKGGGLPIGHGAHLGGALAGVLFFFFYLRRIDRRRMR